MAVTYTQGATLPDLAITWQDNHGDIIDFSTGWTFEVLVGNVGRAADLAKTTGFVGAATAPNLVVIWDDGELDVLDGGKSYSATITATRVADGKQRKMTVAMYIATAVNAVAP